MSEQYFNINTLSKADFLADGGWVKDIIASSAAAVFSFFRLALPVYDTDELMFFPMYDSQGLLKEPSQGYPKSMSCRLEVFFCNTIMAMLNTIFKHTI